MREGKKRLCSPTLPTDTSDVLFYLDDRLIVVKHLVAPDGIYENVGG